ncbi:hypothetical protein [Neptunicoccus cionae]|uniref:Uncharacterized protein n=1 Tax=Neptunicoccus cionae TaxID=2035344 RepID=A0A916VMP3_9RHOB|nr:hypothetical protein [Amylibacter cionae]GGA06224.1 hypothetical protein GCM10011498_02390 [Amylibacter cionae]
MHDTNTRSMKKLSAIATLGKMHERELPCQCIINNGVTSAELRAIIPAIGECCGVPLAWGVFARSVE